MSKYFLDIGWKSIRHAGEELCGDHVDVIDDRNGNMMDLALVYVLLSCLH